MILRKTIRFRRLISFPGVNQYSKLGTSRTFPALYRIQIPLTLIMPCDNFH